VLAVFDQNCDAARPYWVTELCAGGSLRQRLDAAAGKGLPADQAIHLFLQTTYALRAAHQQGLTHGNLKPENVLFDAYGNARVADFGLARVVEIEPGKGMPHVFVGTGGTGYMAPEILARATRDGGAPADIYSLGILLYEMLTGQLPGRRSPLPSAVNASAPAALDAVFDKMTLDRREARYADLDLVLADFYAAFEKGEYLRRGDLILSAEVPAAAPAK
jgi:serine/threonine protein kinase